MPLSQAQIKGRIKNLAKTNKADARILMRIYMMERFLERLAKSAYAENFIIKGGILITSLVGVSMRSTMDIDTSISGFTLSQEETLRVVTEISEIDMDDGVTFSVKSVSGIMDEMDYPGIRLALDEWLQNRHPMSLSQTSKLFFGRSLSNACTDDRDAAFCKGSE